MKFLLKSFLSGSIYLLSYLYFSTLVDVLDRRAYVPVESNIAMLNTLSVVKTVITSRFILQNITPSFLLLLLLIFSLGCAFGSKLLDSSSSRKDILTVGIKISLGLSTILTGYNLFTGSYHSLWALIFLFFYSVLWTCILVIPTSWFVWTIYNRRLQSGIILLLGLAIFFYSSSPEASGVLPEDTERIAIRRPIGSVCSKTDSASEARKYRHPAIHFPEINPWKTLGQSYPDKTRTLPLTANTFQGFNHWIVGYVKFDEPGELKIRAYDNLYGNVYCGFAPFTIAVSPSANFEYVRFPICEVESRANLEISHEVCWFPQSSPDKGIIIYSTNWDGNQYKDSPGYLSSLRAGPLELHQVFEDIDFKHQYSGSLELTLGIIRSLINAKKYEEAISFINNAKSKFDQSNYTSYPNVSRKVVDADEYITLLLLEIGMNFFDNPDALLLELEGIRQGAVNFNKSSCNICTWMEGKSDLFKWLSDSVRLGRRAPTDVLKEVKILDKYSPNPRIFQYLLSNRDKDIEYVTEKHFWIGANCYLNNDIECAEKNIRTFLSKPSHESPSLTVESIVAEQLLIKFAR